LWLVCHLSSILFVCTSSSQGAHISFFACFFFSTAATDVQWTGFQDFGAENYAGMPIAPSAYNPYWGGGMPMGIDGYMATFGGAMPCMGYAPGPYDVPFGGIFPPDPFAQHGFMMPALHPRYYAG